MSPLLTERSATSSYKPVIYAANVCEDDLADDGAGNDMVKRVREFAGAEGSGVFSSDNNNGGDEFGAPDGGRGEPPQDNA